MTVATTVLGLLPIMFSADQAWTSPADCHADVRWHDQLDDLRAVPHPCLFAIGEDIRRRRPEWFMRKAVPAALVLFAVLASSCGGSQSASSSSCRRVKLAI
jgi:hypothetical protein